MSKMQLKKMNKKISYKNIFGLLIALLVFFILFTSIVDLFGKYININQKNDDLLTEKAQLEQREDVLKTQNNSMSTETGEVLLLREKYNSLKDGEEIVIITDIQDKKNEDLDQKEDKKWWYIF